MIKPVSLIKDINDTLHSCRSREEHRLSKNNVKPREKRTVFEEVTEKRPGA